LAKWNVFCLFTGTMKTPRRRPLFLSAVFFATAALAQAHPGHDGDGLTWDFGAGHLATHPLATLVCSLVLVAGAWGAARLVSAGGEHLAAVVRRRGSDRRN